MFNKYYISNEFCFVIDIFLLVIVLYSGQVQAIDPINNPLNNFNGTCDEFNTYRIQKGPVDTKGNNYPTWSGYFKWNAGIEQLKWDYKITRNGNQDCIRVTKIKPKFISSFEKDILRWSPNTSISECCQKEYESWINAALQHENDHEEITNNEINKYKKKLTQIISKLIPTDCFSIRKDKEETKKTISLLIESIRSNENKKLKEIINLKNTQYHDTHYVRTINCEVCKKECKKTYCPCDDPSHGKPKNYDTDTQCAAECPSGLKCFGVQCTIPPVPPTP